LAQAYLKSVRGPMLREKPPCLSLVLLEAV